MIHLFHSECLKGKYFHCESKLGGQHLLEVLQWKGSPSGQQPESPQFGKLEGQQNSEGEGEACPQQVGE